MMFKYILAFISSITLLVLVGDYITWEATMGGIVHAVADVTRPWMQFLFGWFFELFGWEMPNFLKDWLAVGFVTASALVRAVHPNATYIYSFPLWIVIWPWAHALMLIQRANDVNSGDFKISEGTFWATFIMFFAELIFNEALKLIGLPTLPI